MRVWLAAIAAIALFAPAPALALNIGSPAECARLMKQIKHFQTMGNRAQALGNELWTERMGAHLELLRGRQSARCPDDIPVDETGEAFMQLLRIAGQAALAYFTFGAFGMPF